jgi:hypothetical protein
MKHVHSLRFETLEARQLLSSAPIAVAHAARAVAAPLVLNGTLTVDNNSSGSTSTVNADGSTTTSVLVAGRLGALGQVRGFWNHTEDAYGNYEGPDTLHLRDSKGTFIVAFDNAGSSGAHAKVGGDISYEHPQQAGSGTGAYARASERGSIEVTSNAARTHVVSLALHTQNT